MAVVADHLKNPHHQGRLEDTRTNPVLTIQPVLMSFLSLSSLMQMIVWKVSALQTLVVRFPTASASMMTDAVLGKTKQELLELATIFF